MARKLTTIYVEEDLLQQMEELAAKTGRSDQEIFEEALARYLGLQLLRQIQSRGDDLDEDEAMRIAYEELHAMREERDQQSA